MVLVNRSYSFNKTQKLYFGLLHPDMLFKMDSCSFEYNPLSFLDLHSAEQQAACLAVRLHVTSEQFLHLTELQLVKSAASRL